MKKILVIGSTVADIVINLPKLPKKTEDINITSQEMTLGGCAYNVSAMIDLFNVPYTLFSPIGTGLYGDFVRNQLAARGIASKMPTPNMPNGCCYCFVEEDGERTFACHHGAEYIFKKEWFDMLNMNKISSIYICGLEIEDASGDIIVNFLEAHKDIPLFFAPGPRFSYIDRSLLKRIFALHPIVHLNQDEVCSFTEEEDFRKAARILKSLTGNTCIITHGKDGAYYFEGEDFVHVPCPKVDKVVDTIGAGDSHIGAILACLAKGLSMEAAIKKAGEASALVISHKGATLSKEDFTLDLSHL